MATRKCDRQRFNRDVPCTKKKLRRNDTFHMRAAQAARESSSKDDPHTSVKPG